MKLTLLIASVLTASAAFLWFYPFAGKNGTTTYLTEEITRGRLRTVVTATGTVHAVISVDVGSQLSGQIERIYVDFNAPVQAGQPLAQLAQQSYLAEVREAEAALKVAQAKVLAKTAEKENAQSALASALAKSKVFEARTARALAGIRKAENALQRKSRLKQSGTITDDLLDQAQEEFDKAKADQQAALAEQEVQKQAIAMSQAELSRAEAELLVAQARVPENEAALENAKVTLNRTVIRSPIEGVVIARDIAEGQTVAASLEAPKLFTVAGDLRRMEVHTRIDEADIGKIRPGQRARFTVDAFPGTSFDGDVAQIRKSPAVIQNVVTYTVIVATRNPDLLLLPGMTALVDLVVMESPVVAKLPAAALRYQPGDHPAAQAPLHEPEDSGPGTPARVWILDKQGRPEPVTVGIGMSDMASSELTAGPLKAGDRVVVNEVQTSGGGRLLGIRVGF